MKSRNPAENNLYYTRTYSVLSTTFEVDGCYWGSTCWRVKRKAHNNCPSSRIANIITGDLQQDTPQGSGGCWVLLKVGPLIIQYQINLV